MRWIRALPVVFIVPLFAACPAPETDMPVAELPAPPEVEPPDTELMTDRWLEAFHARAFDGVAALYSPDARYVPPTGIVHEGRDGVRAALEEGPPSHLEVQEIRSDAGEQFGYATGRYEQHIDGIEQPLEGHYLLVLEHDGDEWRILEHTNVLTLESQERLRALLEEAEEG